MTLHRERAHSKFSASAAERWVNCSASVELSEGMPDKRNIYSITGEKAHELLEKFVRIELGGNDLADIEEYRDLTRAIPKEMKPKEMIAHVENAGRFVLSRWERTPHADLEVENRVYLKFIHPEMFGTYDNAILDFFGTLHIFDFKYGTHLVSPKKNLQLIFYAIGVAKKHHWNFKNIRLWIIQPRAHGYDGPQFWDLSMSELFDYVEFFKRAVDRVENRPTFKEGAHCHWCKAKTKCPLKKEKADQKALAAFDPV